MSVAKKPKDEHVERQIRRSAHSVARLMPWKWFPWLGEDVVLVDINEGGLKLRLPQKLTIQTGKDYWIRLLLDISDEESAQERHLLCRLQCVWVNEAAAAMGGKFVALNAADEKELREWLGTLARRGKLAH